MAKYKFTCVRLTERYPDRCPDILVAISLILVATLASETLVQVLRSGSLSDPFWLGALTNVPIYVGVIVGAVKLKRSSLDPRYYPRVVRWSAGGAVALAILVGMFAPVIYTTRLVQLGAVRWAFSVGLGGGFMAGYYSARIVDQRVEAERALVRAEEATERQELLEYLNALLRHEVLNATNVVHGRAVMLEDHLDDDPASMDQLEAIRRQANEMSEIVQDVRVLLQANKSQMKFERIDVVEIIETEIQKVKDSHTDVQVDLDVPDEAFVHANDLLSRVFENLFRNALQHTDSTPVELGVSGWKTPSRVVLEISDNGPGIPERLRDDLFTPGVGDLDEDHGIGTVIVGRLVDQFGGEIEILETGPDGTRIGVELPLAAGNQSESVATRQRVPN